MNPYKPGAGHSPPYLAGRSTQIKEFRKLLTQEVITQNVVLTGLRGVGKTVLMDDEYKPLAIKMGWAWVGSDFSESAFVDELTLCTRLIRDLSVFTSKIRMQRETPAMSLKGVTEQDYVLDFHFLMEFFDQQIGLVVDKIKSTLELVWEAVKATRQRGVIFAYDKAQLVRDRKEKDHYPLAVLLDAFQSLQRKGVLFMLLLTGLPTLFGKLVESRTYAERMFKIQELARLNKEECKEAIERPLANNDFRLTPQSVNTIIEVSDGYPYFIQFICREVYDLFKAHLKAQPGQPFPTIPIEPIILKLDSDFFAGRWTNIPDRQRDLLLCIAHLENADKEFTISEIVEISKGVKQIGKPFRTGDVAQMLPRLIDIGLVYKNRHGRYCFAVPMFSGYIKRQFSPPRARIWPPPDQNVSGGLTEVHYGGGVGLW
jgi:hypothetical protein